MSRRVSSVRLTAFLLAVVSLAFGIRTAAQTQIRIARDSAALQRAEQRPPTGTSTISGTVIASDTGLPLAGIHVRLRGDAKSADQEFLPLERMARTDSSGKFCFANLPAGAFRVDVSGQSTPYFSVNYGERRPGGDGKVIRLAEGQIVAIQVPLYRGGVITGRVTGPTGEPLQEVDVAVMRFETYTGVRRLGEVKSVETDDRGIYRIFGLFPGSYVVVAKPDCSDVPADLDADLIADAAERPGLLPTYAPSTLRATDAMVINVGWNDEKSNVDVRLQLTQASIIQGVVQSPLDPGVVVRLSLFSDDPSALDWPPHVTTSSSSGSFSFSDVAPGTYILTAQTTQAPAVTKWENGKIVVEDSSPFTDAKKMWGKTTVTVNGPLVHTSIPLQRSRSISGIVVFDSPRRPEISLVGLTIHAEPVDPGLRSLWTSIPQTIASADGRFTFAGVPGGQYVFSLYFSGHELKSAIASGQDTLDFPLELTADRDVTDLVLTLTDRPSALTGRITDSLGNSADGYDVIIASSDCRYWRMDSRRVQLTSLSHDGQYSFKSLPPGSYQLSVVMDPEPGAINNPEFLRAIARTSIQITITEGAKLTQNLRVK